MLPTDRTRLLFGPYGSPRCKPGRQLRCHIRGDATVRGISDAPIPWPFTWRNHIDRRPSLILCGDLVRAVQQESSTAVAHHWGVSDQTVATWRRALGVPRKTPGTSALHRRWSPETVSSKEATAKRMPTLKSPVRAAKIAAAKRGKPRPRHVIEAMRKANLGRKATKEARANMSAAQKRRGVRPPACKGEPWEKSEETLLGTMKDSDVAARTGRSEAAVSSRRHELGVESFVKRSPRGEPVNWTPAKDRLLGTVPSFAARSMVHADNLPTLVRGLLVPQTRRDARRRSGASPRLAKGVAGEIFVANSGVAGLHRLHGDRQNPCGR